MDQTDVIILIIFLICITYVVYRAIDWLDDQTKYEFDKKAFDADLETKELNGTPFKDILDVKFGFKPDGRYQFDVDDKDENSKQPKEFEVTIVNKSNNISIRIDWDNCTLTNYKQEARRVIRLSPSGTMADVPQEQVFTTVAPKLNLKEKITAEDCFTFNKDTKIFDLTKPILMISQLKKDTEDRKFRDKKLQKRLQDEYETFMLFKAPLQLSLVIAIQMDDMRTKKIEEDREFLTCHVKITRVRWLDQLPWSPK
ncbi:MAG: hypothetical protein HC769_21345 [Cyanobacteria bacterium CRU_2_1]|nr:hypothetical protein [Cyanobacteria bacterium RU_5_0]NJR61146.1 hypothetical protein [Cyanobacteria bacterium CRU_2_1]